MTGRDQKEIDFKQYAEVEKVPGGMIKELTGLKSVMFNKDGTHPGMKRRIENANVMQNLENYGFIRREAVQCKINRCGSERRVVRHAGNADEMPEGEEKNVLPGHSDVRLERAKIKLLGGIQNFDPESPAQGSGKEPNGGTKLVRQCSERSQRGGRRRNTSPGSRDSTMRASPRSTPSNCSRGQSCYRESSPRRPSLRSLGRSTGAGGSRS